MASRLHLGVQHHAVDEDLGNAGKTDQQNNTQLSSGELPARKKNVSRMPLSERVNVN